MRILKRPNRFQLFYASLLIAIVLSITLLVDNHHKTIALEKELNLINKKIYLNEVNFEKKQKDFLKLEKKHKKETDSIRKQP